MSSRGCGAATARRGYIATIAKNDGRCLVMESFSEPSFSALYLLRGTCDMGKFLCGCLTIAIKGSSAPKKNSVLI